MDRKKEIKDFIERCKHELSEKLEEHKTHLLEKFRKYNLKPKVKQQRNNYYKTERGAYSRSLANYTRRVRFDLACEELSWEEKIEIGKFYKNCPKGYEVDHIYPISKGGLHRLSNLQYLTKEDNRRKSNSVVENEFTNS